VAFNNQISVILSMHLGSLLCLLHDNRIYAFLIKNPQQPTDGSSSVEQNLLLNLLTTPKYRSLSAMYMAFRLMDNLSFLSIIVLSIINGALTQPTEANLALFSAIGLELFYNVILQTTKYWILERLSIYIGIVLYIIYGFVIALKNMNGEYTPEDLQLVIGILGARFISFIFEEFVDIALDGALHNDLLILQKEADKTRQDKTDKGLYQIIEIGDEEAEAQNRGEDENQPCIQKQSMWDMVKNYFDVSLIVKMPPDVQYVGSFFAWSPYSVFNENVWNKKKNSYMAPVFTLLYSFFGCILACSVVDYFMLSGCGDSRTNYIYNSFYKLPHMQSG